MAESIPTPPFSEDIQVASEETAANDVAAGTFDNTDTTPVPAVVVLFLESLWDGPVDQEHVVDQPESVQPPIDVLINAPVVFHPIETLYVEIPALPIEPIDPIPQLEIHQSHPTENIIGSLSAGIRTRSISNTINKYLFLVLFNRLNPKITSCYNSIS